MIAEIKCRECEVDYVLEFDELECDYLDEDPMTPEYCPFCGTELHDVVLSEQDI